jgi:hypothetical protein
MNMKKPYPKETEIHEKFSIHDKETLIELEAFFRKSFNTTSAAGLAGTDLRKRCEIARYYLAKLNQEEM